MYRTPYDVFESIHGPYNPDVVPVAIFSVWMSAEKSEYMLQFPNAVKNQIDGHFFEMELKKFFRWISDRKR